MFKSLRYAYPSSNIARALGYSDESGGVSFVVQYNKKEPAKLPEILQHIVVKGSNKEHIKLACEGLQGKTDAYCHSTR